jgi:MFS transporter, putative metabolite:H+ symporter
VNKRWRGTAVGYANALLGFSYGLDTLAGALAVRHLAPETAWRALLMIGGLPILMVPVIIRYLPESPRFLLEAGKTETVRSFVEQLENLSGVPHDEQLIDAEALKVLQYSATRKVSIFDLFRPPYLQRCVIAFGAAPFVTFHVITIYGPTLIHRMGASPQNALRRRGDCRDRRRVLRLCGLRLAKLYMAEQFPPQLRGSGVILGESVTRFIGGVVLVYLFPILDAQLGQGTVFVNLGIRTESCMLPILLFGFRTSGISVGQTGTDPGLATDVKAREFAS